MYQLHLTDNDISTLCFVGGRYEWSRWVLFYLDPGDNDIPEPIAWDLKKAFEDDTEGGHSMFPMLSSECKLYDKLIEFYESIV